MSNSEQEKTCALCNKSFHVPPCRASVAKYCSRRCYEVGKRNTHGKFWTLCTPTESGCWMFHNASEKHPYGRYMLNLHEVSAHRASWEISHGAIPNGMHVCHKCDAPGCVNPEHLFLGTAKDNVMDMVRKGRAVGNRSKGELASHVVLNEDQVRKIRASTAKHVELARELNVSPGAIRSVRARRSWKHV